TVAVAESCTGGLMAGRLTDAPGSSAYFLGGAVAYSNDAKAAVVGVDRALIETYGAVSVGVARALAEGARERVGASLGTRITGIAGPDGGTEAKPVGTVCFSVALGGGTDVERSLTRSARLPGGRADVRDRATTVTMHMLEQVLRGEGD